MIVSLVFMAVVAFIVGRWLFKQDLAAKPWLVEGVDEDLRGTIDVPNTKLGLWVFIGVATALFALFLSAYNMRIQFADWISPPDPGILWLNTGVLALSSAALEWARVGARRENIDQARFGLLAGGGLAVIFLIGQLIAWRQLDALGYFAASNPANAFFYLLTALHGLHLLGGLVAWAKTNTKMWHVATTEQIRGSLDLCAIYWHFLLLVWLVLFGLLLAT